MSKKPPQQQKKVKWSDLPAWRKILILFILGSFALLLIVITLGESDNKSTDKGMTAQDSARNAFIISKHYIKQQLKAPSTADFPFADYQSYRNDSTGSITIVSYVDAQNAFGAQIRTNYRVELKQNDGDWANPYNWQVVDIQME